jgi:hypothetical protein
MNLNSNTQRVESFFSKVLSLFLSVAVRFVFLIQNAFVIYYLVDFYVGVDLFIYLFIKHNLLFNALS